MSKREFIKMLVSSFGYSNIQIKMYWSGTNDGQSENTPIWEVKAKKKDYELFFQEITFERFIYELSRLLCRNQN